MTLTEAAFWTKRVGVIALAGFGVFVVAAFVLTSLSDPPKPPEYLTPNWACTETKEEFLEQRLEIPSLAVNTDSENVFEIETDTGKVNSLSSLDIINVYAYKKEPQKLDNQLQAKSIASYLGFEAEEIYRKGTTDYIWTNPSIERSLTVDAKTLNFVMTTDRSYVRDIAKSSPVPTETEAISLAKNAVRRLEILGKDFNYNDAGNITTHLIDINPDRTYSEAPSLSEAEMVRVDFHKTKPMISIRENIENSRAMINSLNRTLGQATEDEIIVNERRITIYQYSTIVTYQNPTSSNISVYVGPRDSSTRTLSNIYEIDFTYWPIEQESCGTYELVSPGYAIDKVQEGEASLVYLNDRDGDEIVDYQPRSVSKYIIYDIAIAYYESVEQPTFLQPIYVISGETVFKNETRGEFHFFYPAINYDIVGDRVTLPEAPVSESSGSSLGL